MYADHHNFLAYVNANELAAINAAVKKADIEADNINYDGYECAQDFLVDLNIDGVDLKVEGTSFWHVTGHLASSASVSPEDALECTLEATMLRWDGVVYINGSEEYYELKFAEKAVC